MRKFRCIECNENDTSDLICTKCGFLVDHYLDCDYGVIFIDFILCSTKCFRHLIFNRFTEK